MAKFGFKNLFGKSDDFFDKEATIKEYFAIVPPSERKKCKTYDELYQEALQYVKKQSFKENTADIEDYFYEINTAEGALAVTFGMIAFYVAYEVDKNGAKIEDKLDDIVNKVLGNGYDTINPYDSMRRGKGHRSEGHDVFSFGLKNIPGDALIVSDWKTGARKTVAEFLGVSKDSKISMWEIIWKFYGNGDSKLKGVMSCLSHTIVHFAKDLFTPDGLPLPFTSIFEKFSFANKGGTIGSEVDYTKSLLKKEMDLGLEMKASDFASLAVIETLVELYIASRKKELGDKSKELKQDIKLISMGTCLSMQMAAILTYGQLKTSTEAHKPGAKVNVLMTSAFMKLTVQEMTSIYKARHSISKTYKSGYMRGYNNGTE